MTWQLTESARITPSTLTCRSAHLKNFASETFGIPEYFRSRAAFTESAFRRTATPYLSHAVGCRPAGFRGAVICTSVRMAVVRLQPPDLDPQLPDLRS